jgi:RimJ/RimL family protein N-acetyltransferase
VTLQGTGGLEARWLTPQGALLVVEPTDAEMRQVSTALAGFYNDPHNAALLTNTVRFTPRDVVDFLRDARAAFGRPFFLYWDGELVGDGDFRNIDGTSAELALLVGPRSLQGRGLGRRFATIAMALAFLCLGLEQVYVVIRPENAASLRMFGALGFGKDAGPQARAFAEEEDEVCMSLTKAHFLDLARVPLGEIQMGRR